MPGGLSFVPSHSSGSNVEIHPGAGDRITAVGYSSSPGHGIPEDAEPRNLIADTRPNGLSVPSDHRVVTATLESKSGKDTSAVLIGPGFLDSAEMPKGESAVTVSPDDGTIGAPSLPAGTTLSATTVSGEVQQTATVTFSGRVRRPRVSVKRNGMVTVTTANGSGKATIKLASFAPGHKARAPRQTVRIHGHTRFRGHTPKVKHRKHPNTCKKGSAHKKRHC
jgi:hypothetical protein